MSKTAHAADDGVVRLVDDVLARAFAGRASDVHLEPHGSGLRIRYRLDGLLHDVGHVPRSLAENVIARLKVMAGLLTYRIDVPQEGSFVLRGNGTDPGAALDARVATFPTVRGERAVIRLMHGSNGGLRLNDLGLRAEAVAALRQAADQPQGLILATGPAGAGKSTTLYAVARHILETTPGRSVVSLEDPVEQQIDGMVQIQVQPFGELDYPRAMRSLLRQDLQVLLIGEIRDAETAHVVIQAALTGHLILSTMHSGDPAEAIHRLLEMGIAPYQAAGAVSLICSQRLFRVVCRSCRGEGCDSCLGSGWRGRAAYCQMAALDGTLRDAILRHAPADELRRCLARHGPDLFADAQRWVEAGRTTADEVRRVLGEPPPANLDLPRQAATLRLAGVIPCNGSTTKD